MKEIFTGGLKTKVFEAYTVEALENLLNRFYQGHKQIEIHEQHQSVAPVPASTFQSGYIIIFTIVYSEE